jgi:hypothetical protein
MINRVILTGSALVGVASIAVVVNLRPYQNEFLAGLCVGVFAVCLLPWLVHFRRTLFPTQASAGRGWMKAVTMLLFIALLSGPLATASYHLWLKAAKPTDDWGGFGPAVGLVVIALLFHCVGVGACIIAFLIQLWRDQWKKVLNVLAIAYQLLAYLYLCTLNG